MAHNILVNLILVFGRWSVPLYFALRSRSRRLRSYCRPSSLSLYFLYQTSMTWACSYETQLRFSTEQAVASCEVNHA